MSFRKLEAQTVEVAKTVPLVLNQLRGEPVLHVEHLGETNKPFWNDALARANATAGISSGKRMKITDAKIRETRLKNRELVAKYSVRGLENVFHDDGKPAGAEDIRDVVFALPDDVFDAVLGFVSDPNNFRDVEIEGDAEDLAGK